MVHQNTSYSVLLNSIGGILHFLEFRALGGDTMMGGTLQIFGILPLGGILLREGDTNNYSSHGNFSKASIL